MYLAAQNVEGPCRSKGLKLVITDVKVRIETQSS